jgi:hypothetical protein
METMNMKRNADSKRITRALWGISAVAFGLTALAGAHEVTKPHSHQEWITMNLPSPPAPLPDSAVPAGVSSDLK